MRFLRVGSSLGAWAVPGIVPAGASVPVCEVLAALVPGRVLPFAPGDSRKRGPESVAEDEKLLAQPWWSAERRAGSSFKEPAPRPATGAVSGWMRLSALRVPSLL